MNSFMTIVEQRLVFIWSVNESYLKVKHNNGHFSSIDLFFRCIVSRVSDVPLDKDDDADEDDIFL